MDNNLNISVIGGDTRLLYTAQKLKAEGAQVSVFGFELADTPLTGLLRADSLDKAMESEIIVLGLPCSKNGETLYAPFSEKEIFINDISKRSYQNQIIFAGMPQDSVLLSLKSGGAMVFDYFKDEALTLYNAMLTAEAITGILIKKLPCSLLCADIAVIGYGRIGFYLVKALNSLGAKVTVFSRNATQLAKARTLGIKAEKLSSFADKKREYRALINTVPSQVIKENELKRLNGDCFLIEAASAPYGIDAAAAEELGFTVFSAPSLPGKYSPESAGNFIAETVFRQIGEVKDSG